MIDDQTFTSELPSESPAKSDPANSPSDTIIQPQSAPIVDARAFVLAGKAIFTLVGKDSRYTYKVQLREGDNDRYQQDAYFVSLLTGPDNTSEYTYLGMLNSQAGTVRLTRKSAYKDDSRPVMAIRWALGRIWAGKDIPAPAQILHAGRCGRCGRLLTVPASIVSGYGPECIGKL